MGNCMETCRENQQDDPKKQQQQLEEEEEEKTSGFMKESGFGKGGIRVKVVLTKEELQWLMFQLNNKGDKKFEDILEEIERARGRLKVEQAGWKPSLESIMEIPELLEMDR